MSESPLFYAEPLLQRKVLRDFARECNETSPLIAAAGDGDIHYARALMMGFWPFVHAFPKIIDMRSASLPIKSLMRRFGRSCVIAKIRLVKTAVDEMMKEEGEHTGHWIRDSRRLGLTKDDLADISTPLVHSLIEESLQATTAWEWLATLAGTEYIAEELARYFLGKPAFLALFNDEVPVWHWGAAHLITAHDGPSHLEIDEDLARACHPLSTAVSSVTDEQVMLQIENKIFGYCELFQRASVEVYNKAKKSASSKYVVA